jgi:hypothetical protein
MPERNANPSVGRLVLKSSRRPLFHFIFTSFANFVIGITAAIAKAMWVSWFRAA